MRSPEECMDQMNERRRAGADAGNLQKEVSLALALQREVGTVAAVEHLKTAGAESALIARVLCGQQVRAGDGALEGPLLPEAPGYRAMRHTAAQD